MRANNNYCLRANNIVANVGVLLSGRQNSLPVRASQNDARIASSPGVRGCAWWEHAILFARWSHRVMHRVLGSPGTRCWPCTPTESIGSVVSKGIDCARFLQLSKMTDMSLPRLASCRCSAHYAMSQLLHTIPSPFMPIPTHDSGPGSLSRRHDFQKYQRLPKYLTHNVMINYE